MSGCYDSMSKEIEMDYTKLFEHINERLDKLELRLDKLSAYTHHTIDKKPHKCPVCDGKTSEPLIYSKDLEGNPNIVYVICNACEGKGIVWG